MKQPGTTKNNFVSNLFWFYPHVHIYELFSKTFDINKKLLFKIYLKFYIYFVKKN